MTKLPPTGPACLRHHARMAATCTAVHAPPRGEAGGRGVGEGTMAMKNPRDLFAQTDQQVSVLKERIARQREAIKLAKLRGHSTAAAETIQHTLHQSLRAFEKRRQEVFERVEAKQASSVKQEAEEDWGRERRR